MSFIRIGLIAWAWLGSAVVGATTEPPAFSVTPERLEVEITHRLNQLRISREIRVRAQPKRLYTLFRPFDNQSAFPKLERHFPPQLVLVSLESKVSFRHF